MEYDFNGMFWSTWEFYLFVSVFFFVLFDSIVLKLNKVELYFDRVAHSPRGLVSLGALRLRVDLIMWLAQGVFSINTPVFPSLKSITSIFKLASLAGVFWGARLPASSPKIACVGGYIQVWSGNRHWEPQMHLPTCSNGNHGFTNINPKSILNLFTVNSLKSA